MRSPPTAGRTPLPDSWGSRGRAGETAVEPAGGDVASQQCFVELPAVHAQVGLLDVLLGQTGVLVELGGDGRFVLGCQFRALRECLPVVAERELFHFGEEGARVPAVVRQLVVVPRRGGVGWVAQGTYG